MYSRVHNAFPLNNNWPQRPLSMIHMSNKNSKRNIAIVVLVIVVIAAVAGGYYFMTSSSSTSQTTSMEQISTMMSETSSMTTQQSMMSSETMSSATTMASVTSSVAGWQPTASVSITGAGATFPQPLIQKWTVTYNQLYPQVQISYNGIGSGGGIQQITAKVVDFGCSDAPLSNAQFAAAPGLVLFPETLGGVAITYNLATYGIPSSTVLHFTSSVIAQI